MVFLSFGYANAASYDCNLAKTEVEIKICENSDLSRLDEIMSSLYSLSKSILPNSDEAKKTQIRWLKIRNECNSSQCIAEAYNDHIDEMIYRLESSEIDFMAATKIMLNQRDIKLGISDKELTARLEYGSVEWGGCFGKECRGVGMPLNIHPLICELNEYSSKECSKSVIWQIYWLRFYVDELNQLSKVTLNNGLVLLGN